MENKHVGLLIMGIALIMSSIVLFYNISLRKIVSTTCSHGPQCTMYEPIKTQMWIGLSIVLVIFLLGLIFTFTKPKEKIIIKKIKEKKKKLNLDNLDKDEKQIVKILQEENNTIFQATLAEKLETGKVKLTRLLDKLEAKQIIERKRRGMNNVVVLKNQ